MAKTKGLDLNAVQKRLTEAAVVIVPDGAALVFVLLDKATKTNTTFALGANELELALMFKRGAERTSKEKPVKETPRWAYKLVEDE